MADFNCRQFASHLLKLAALEEIVSHHVVKGAAKIIQSDAQSRIGSYQDGIGGFPAWANLADATVADRISKGFTPDDPLLRTGTLRDSIEVKAEGNEAIVGTPDEVALYQECGTSSIPPRPFLGPAGFASQHQIGAMAAKTMISWVGGLPWKEPPELIN